ncbi:MAG: nucleotidyltransferase family protein [Psychroserpens sp.]|uniref:nucleotidyltransferase family protein n=1 Tax=Psychroserpens sp. TaxID=2020870 RepID=UPI003CB024AD
MPKKKHTYKQSLDFIVETLSFDFSSEKLQHKIQTTTIDWDNFVAIASDHLILTACYCRLQQRQLLDFIPKDLNKYLQELTAINRNRNLTIIDELKHVTRLFDKHRINYALLKGAALITGNFYKDIAERMVGDIDILVSRNQIALAFTLLKKAGYDKLITFNYEVKHFRHYPRQIHPERLAAIELHTSILNSNYKGYINETKFLNSTTVINQFNIPSNYYLNIANILSLQISSHGYRYKLWDLKHFYDSACLSLEEQDHLPDHKYNCDYISKFQLLFHMSESKPLKLYSSKISNDYKFRIEHYRLYAFFNKWRSLFYVISERINLLIMNKSYRTHIIKNKIMLKVSP